MASSITAIQAEKGKIDQVVSEFFASSLNVILDARIPHISEQNRADGSSHLAATNSNALQGSRASSPWFNLDMGSGAVVVENAEPWRWESGEPMVVDVLLQQPVGGEIATPSGSRPPFLKDNPGGDSWSGGEGFASSGLSRTLLERWVVQYMPRERGYTGSEASKTPKGFGESSPERHASSSKGVVKSIGSGRLHAVERPAVYKRAVIMLRSLYCTMRTLPAHRLFRLVKSSAHSRSFTLSYKVSFAPVQLSEANDTAMMACSLTPVETLWGKLCVSVAYRHTTAVTALEITPPMLPRIIPDYVGSPTTDPLRRFFNVGSPGTMSGRKGVHVVSLPTSLPSSPSDPYSARRHSWSGGHQKFPLSVFSKPSFPANSPPSPSYTPDSKLHQRHSSSYLTAGTSRPQSHVPQTPPHPSLHGQHVSRTACSLHREDENSSVSLPVRNSGQPMSFSPSSPQTPPNPRGGSMLVDERFRGGLRTQGSLPPQYGSPRHKQETYPCVLIADRPPQLPFGSQVPPLSPRQIGKDNSCAMAGTPMVLTGHGSPLPIPTFSGRLAPHISPSAQAKISLSVSPTHIYCQVGGEKDDGPPSGIKRSLYSPPRLINLGTRVPKTPSQDEVGEEFPYPFDVNDDEAGDVRSRMEGLHMKNDVDELEQAHQWSQNAAAGALVRTLNSAPPLRRRNSPKLTSLGFPCRGSGLPLAVGNKEAGLEQIQHGPLVLHRNGPHSKSFVGSRRQFLEEGSSPLTSALEELRGYIEMRDHLLRQSGGQFQYCAPAKHI